MHTGTGGIVDTSFVEKLKVEKDPTANFYKKIPEEYIEMLLDMNRADRRKWYKENKSRLEKEK